MQVLITGAGGFVAPHLIRHIQKTAPDTTIHGGTYSNTHNALPNVQYHQIDLLDYDATRQWLQDVTPDTIYHLAGQSSPSKALGAVWQTLETNIRIQLNLFEACVELGIKPRFVSVSSGDIYTGIATDDSRLPITEAAEIRPCNPYALSKATQDLMGFQYHMMYQLPVIRVRAFNHTGPGQQTSFVAPDFAFQIAKIEAGLQEPLMRVGNLQAKRDFTDVRDVVRAYMLLTEKGEVGTAYNVSSNKAYSIEYLLETLLGYTSANIKVEIDPNRYRPVDVPLIQGDNTRLVNLTGWHPEISFEKTLQDLLAHCRAQVQRTMRSNN